MKPIGFFERGGTVPKSFFFEKPNKTMSFFRSALVQKCLGTLLRKSFAYKSFIQRESNTSCLISYFDVLL